MRSSVLVLLTLAFFVPVPTRAATGPNPAPAPIVTIDSGQIRGEILPGAHPIHVFRGIPFAAPPTGDRRWRPPAPVTPWKSVRDCTHFGPVCPQPRSPLGGVGPNVAQSEDCLTVNVWTPAASGKQKLPVMVFIHGGGHVVGAGSLRYYDGTALARRGVVLVTMNYRLGPFGYLSLPGLAQESSDGTCGNDGLLDQIAALSWVHRNARAFGGDPGRVTVFGESAGGVSVACLLCCPAARGLFQRAIAESGGPVGVAKKMRFDQGIALEKALGCDKAKDPLAAMRKLSPAKILAAADPAAATLKPSRKYGPCVDGKLLPEDPVKLFEEGKVADVPFIAGSNADDGGIFSRHIPVRRAAGYRLLVKKRFGAHAADVLALFPPDGGVSAALRKLLTVAVFALPARIMVRAESAGKTKAYLYQFTRVCPGAALMGLGATHGLEIPYVFDTAPKLLGFTATDKKLSDLIRRYWTHFAATGNPNGEGLPAWPAWDSVNERHLELGSRIRPGAKLFDRECNLLERIGSEK